MDSNNNNNNFINNCQGFSPEFVASALRDIDHKFLFVLECESREKVLDNCTIPPKFCIGGRQATHDPRTAYLTELFPVTKRHSFRFPDGWVRVHQFIYVLSPNTDEHGWEYRSEFSDGPLGNDDEPWSPEKKPSANARRRLWMTSFCRTIELVTVKRTLCDLISKRHKTLIMEGEIFRRENTSGSIIKTWQKRYVYLQNTCIEIYNLPKTDGGKKLAEIQLQECECTLLLEGDHPYAFSISHPSRSTPLAMFDPEDFDSRRRWVIAITYQLMILDPFVNFPPFDYAPRTADADADTILLAGELDKQSYDMGRSWSKKTFELTTVSLRFYSSTEKVSALPIAGAELSPLQGSLEFSIKSGTKIIVMRAENAATKAFWLSAISRQIVVLMRKADAKKTGAGVGKIKSNPSTPTTPTQAANAFFQAGGNSKEKDKGGKDAKGSSLSSPNSGPCSPSKGELVSMNNSSHEDLLAAAAKKLLSITDNSKASAPQGTGQHPSQQTIISQSVNSSGQTLTNKPSFLLSSPTSAGAQISPLLASRPSNVQSAQVIAAPVTATLPVPTPVSVSSVPTQVQPQVSALPASSRAKIHHDADMFGEMDVVESSHDHESFSSDEEPEPEEASKFTDEEKDTLLKKTSSGNITAMGQRNPQQQQHHYVPSRHIPTLPVSPTASPSDNSKLLRAASMKVMPSSSKADSPRLYSPSLVHSADYGDFSPPAPVDAGQEMRPTTTDAILSPPEASPSTRLSTIQARASQRQSSVLAKVLKLETKIEEKSKSFYIPSPSSRTFA